MSAQGAPIYESDPDRPPDSHFQAGNLRLLMPGNAGRLLDARRTPVAIVGLNVREGTFEVEIQAFEDRGARWSVPFEDAHRYQFELDSELADDEAVAAYEQAVRRLDRPLRIEPDAATRASSLLRLASEYAAADRWLAENGPERIDPAPQIASREGAPELIELLERYLSMHELSAIDARFAEAFVSNPRAGDTVKGHAIVLAQLGLCPYAGKVVRSARTFVGDWTEELRARHLLTRMAFTRALWSRTVHAEHPLYRAIASDGPLREREPHSFVSCTFSLDLALEHFRGGPTTATAAIRRQPLPLERLLMTFLETRAMSARFSEAEAVLIGDPPTWF